MYICLWILFPAARALGRAQAYYRTHRSACIFHVCVHVCSVHTACSIKSSRSVAEAPRRASAACTPTLNDQGRLIE